MSNEEETGTIIFRSDRIPASFLFPNGSETKKSLDVRFDPLLGTSSRIAEGVILPKADDKALAPLQIANEACPFCPGQIRRVTPRILPQIYKDGRLERGESVLFPNLVPYSQYAAVVVLSTQHWLAVNEFAPQRLFDSLSVAVEYVQRVYTFDPRAQYCAYNINYLYPSGGSLPHPHAQVYLDPHPTTFMRMQAEAGSRYWQATKRSYWEDLVAAEEARAERFIARIGSTTWITAFAPLGFNEVQGIVSGRETLLDLTHNDLNALARGISQVLRWYHSIGYNSFNLALYSGALQKSGAWRVHLSLITRTAMLPYYRSDSMHLERLHWEAAVDRPPEEIAADLRAYFESA